MDAKSPECPTPEDEFVNETAKEIVDALLYKPDVHVIGVGGCGCNTIEHITEQNMDSVKTVAINTDDRVLDDLNVDRQMLIGKEVTDGNGAQGDHTLGKRAAQKSEAQILKTIEEADMVVIAAGLGGGTGGGASKVIADIAKRNGKMVFTYAVMPFSSEKERHDRAEDVLDQMSKISNATTVFENDKTLTCGEQSMADAFALADKMLHRVVKKIKMNYITEFFDEIGLDAMGLSENISDVENDKEGEEEVEEPPVLKALKYVDKNGDDEPERPEPEVDDGEPKLEDFLENYAQ
ncbi:MAG: hypothetical protein KGY76_04870 [Candidatus Thermoplasmatota archaeon]|nr:hypothetical protein [Candidatus Thermoplasmatota archaeon]